ncbi:hypothetical protein XI06_15440 [Bradyrhizobium sp. CCBAU 11434]|nr:hypothetical protein [Bradyrhizobium sp. CCBAU 11434]
MTLICATRTVWIPLWVNVQDHSSHFAPVRSLTLRLQKANVSDDVLLVIGCQRRLIGRIIRHVWIEEWSVHIILTFGAPSSAICVVAIQTFASPVNVGLALNSFIS